MEKGSIKKIKSYLLNKNTTTLLLIIAVGILISDVFIYYISQFIVEPILSHIEPSIWKDIVWILIVIYIIGYFINNFRKHYLPDDNIINYSILLALSYIYFRFIETNTWLFTSLETINSLRYTDILLLTGFVSFIYKMIALKSLFKDEAAPKSDFFVDVPLRSLKDDLLGYEFYASSIAEVINSSTFKNAFAIGVTSKWGGGKTSFFNMIEEKLDTDLIKVHFNPWRSITPQSIIKDFFQTVQESFSIYSSRLSKLLNDYCDKIIALDDNAVTKGAKLLLSFSNKDSLGNLFEQINRTITKLDKRLIIFIDDVDRLDKDEAFEVIRLIRNTANFHNTCFIVAYDRTYILHTLKNINIHHYEKFLEKIFQLEITLPYFDKNILATQFIKNMKRIFPNRKEAEIDNLILKKDGDKILFLEWIQTMRDVTRLSNSIMLNIKNVEQDVDLIDFIRIEILRFKFPSVYEVLFKINDSFFTLEYSNVHRREMLFLSKLEINTQNDTTVLENYIRKHRRELTIEKEDIDKIINFISDIFSDDIKLSLSNNYVAPSHLSITNNDRFPLYFAYGMIPGLLSEKEFSETIKQDLPKLLGKIDDWISELKEEKLKSRLNDLEPSDILDKKSFENIIRAIFYLANKESLFFKNGMLVKYDFNNLYEKINSKSKFIKDTYNYSNIEYKKFIKSIFDNPQSSYYFEAEFLKHCSAFADSNNNLPIPSILDAREIEYYLVKFLKLSCDKESELSWNIWYFWDNCKIPSLVRMLHPSEEIHRDVVFPEARKIFIDFISKKDLNNFLLYNLHIDFMHDVGKFQIGTIGNEVFGSIDKFKIFLFEQDEKKWSYLKEYKTFFTKAMNKKSELIPFDFKVIDIQKRIKAFQEQNR